ncbi:hypothetical protein SAURM35S_09922 [Streptomyces aurantiogriseus]
MAPSGIRPKDEPSSGVLQPDAEGVASVSLPVSFLPAPGKVAAMAFCRAVASGSHCAYASG